MSEAIELYKQQDGDFKATGVFYCSECRAVFPNRDQAQGCHGERICECGQPIKSRYQQTCDDCWRKDSLAKEAKKEAERFEKATKISAADYKGEMVFLDDEYFNDVADAIDDYEEGQEPEYVWACKDVGVPRATAENIYENLLENMWEDADASDLNGVVELEAAIEAFNEANKSTPVYYPDYSTAILVSRESA